MCDVCHYKFDKLDENTIRYIHRFCSHTCVRDVYHKKYNQVQKATLAINYTILNGTAPNAHGCDISY